MCVQIQVKVRAEALQACLPEMSFLRSGSLACLAHRFAWAAAAAVLFVASVVAEEEGCWQKGYSRAICCYDAARRDACFDGHFTKEKCCAPVLVETGPRAFFGYLGDPHDRLLADYLFALNKRVAALPEGPRGGAGAPAAENIILRELGTLERHLQTVANNTEIKRNYAALPGMVQGYFFLLAYFVSQEALSPWLGKAVRRLLVKREASVWSGFATLYRKAFGYTDFCRCMEGGEFYSHINMNMRAAGFGKHTFLRTMFNGSYPEHHILRQQQCKETRVEGLFPESTMTLIFTTGCVSGDVGMAMLLLQGCVLEQDVRKTLLLHDNIFRLATLAADCHDAKFWPYSIRDVAVQYARVIWEIARRPGGKWPLATPLLRRLAWDPPKGDQPPLWHRQCGPHEIRQPVRVRWRREEEIDARLAESLLVLGAVCTEIGRFWLRLEATPDDTASTRRTLAVIPVTYPWWSNPWHHLHWWLPAVWYLRLQSKLRPEETDVALAFPHPEAHWGRAATVKVTAPERTEPEAWSFLYGGWPRTKPKHLKPWHPDGLHADVVAMLSTEPARPLQEYNGRTYTHVTVGLPPIRFTVQTPRVTCAQVASVKSFVETMPKFLALDGLGNIRVEGGKQQRGGRRVCSIIQRKSQEGRSIQNLTEVVMKLEEHFSSELDVRVVRGLSRGFSWIEQYHAIRRSDILVAVGGAALGWLWALPHGSAAIELRAASSPIWLPCSERWNVDFREMFGGLARLSGVHHICVRPHAVGAKALENAGLSNPFDFKPYNREEDIHWHPEKARGLIHQALRLLDGQKPLCEDGHREL